jgi:hypothetical protein
VVVMSTPTWTGTQGTRVQASSRAGPHVDLCWDQSTASMEAHCPRGACCAVLCNAEVRRLHCIVVGAQLAPIQLFRGSIVRDLQSGSTQSVRDKLLEGGVCPNGPLPILVVSVLYMLTVHTYADPWHVAWCPFVRPCTGVVCGVDNPAAWATPAASLASLPPPTMWAGLWVLHPQR